MRKVLNGPIGDELAATLLKSGIRVLGWWERGPRMLTTNKAVKSPADLKGMKIRVPEIPVSVDAWRALGTNPTPMAFGEVYSGLQQKVIDGQENPLAIIATAKLNEVQKFVMQDQPHLRLRGAGDERAQLPEALAREPEGRHGGGQGSDRVRRTSSSGRTRNCWRRSCTGKGMSSST